MSHSKYDPKMYNANGNLKDYALCCGYVNTKRYGKVVIRFWHELGTYHVRGHDENTNTRLFWESFDNYREALMFFNNGDRIPI